MMQSASWKQEEIRSPYMQRENVKFKRKTHNVNILGSLTVTNGDGRPQSRGKSAKHSTIYDNFWLLQIIV